MNTPARHRLILPTNFLPKKLLSGLALLSAVMLAGTCSVQAVVSFRSDTGCADASGNVFSISDAITCGSVSGSARALYYTTHNAYFVRGLNQDTISYGGFIKYQTAPLYGFDVGIGGIFLRGINHGDSSRVITDIGANQTNIGEAYLNWKQGNLRVTAGNQRLSIPFVGDYDFRITPMIYQALDLHYGDGEDFLRATKIWRFKSFGSERVQQTTNYTEVTEKTHGMWALGAGHHLQASEKKLSGQMWYESYNDFTRLFYAEGHVIWQQTPFAPNFGLQYIRGTGEGKKYLGEVDNRSYGAQLALSLTKKISWTLGYDHLSASGNSYGNGSLVTPYAHNTASGPYFAQPYFTSTQDLGSGNAYSTDINGQINNNLTVGGRYTFMDLTPKVNCGSRNQSEYLGYFIWKFDGALAGLSLNDFFGVQTSPLYGSNFWQNRVTLQYDF